MNNPAASPISARLDFVLALIMATAAVCTAWAGFESTKWSGIQADSYAEASAARTEANRFENEAGQERIVDIVTFTHWLNAINVEIAADPSARPTHDYEPTPGTISAFIFQRFRTEFRPAVDAWLRTEPFINEGAPATPFVLAEYSLAAETEARRQDKLADDFADQARDANQFSDSYVLMAVLFALVLFFSALSDRASGRRMRAVLFGLAFAGLVISIGLLMTFPVQI